MWELENAMKARLRVFRTSPSKKKVKNVCCLSGLKLGARDKLYVEMDSEKKTVAIERDR